MNTTTETKEETKVLEVIGISFDGILSAEAVQVLTGLSRVTIWREEKAGRFPARVQITANRIGWIGSEIKHHLETRPRVNPGPCDVESGAIE